MKKILIPILILASIILVLASQTSQEEPKQSKQNIKKEKKQTSDLSLESEIKKSYPKPDYDVRLNIDPRAEEWYDMSDMDSASSYNIGNIYLYEIKDYEKAEFWFKKAYSIEHNLDALFNLGIVYEDIKKIDKSIFFYKKAAEFGDKSASNNLAALYYNLKIYNKAEHWYKKAIKKGNISALQGFGIMNYEILKDNIQAVKYMIAIANKKYPKEKLIKFFKVKWNLDDETIKKGYEEQLKAKDIPEDLKYKGGI